MKTFEDFYSAAECGDLETVKEIFNKQPELISGTGEWGFAVMHGAVMTDDEELLNFLIKNGADVNARNDEGIRPLHIVLYPEIAQILIDNGAEINALSNEGETALHVMAAEGDQTIDVVQLLLEHGADKNLKNKWGKTAFDIAKSREEIELLAVLK